MSWRVLIGFLLLVGIGCWRGGIELGQWLITKAPPTIASVNDAKNQSGNTGGGATAPAQPPQPRIDGSLGVPKPISSVDWSVLPVSVNGIVRDADGMIKIDVPKVDGDVPTHNPPTQGSTASQQGPYDITTIEVPRAPIDERSTTPSPRGPSTAPVRPVVAPTPITRPADHYRPTEVASSKPALSWQQALKADIDQCGRLKFFDRPRCVEQAQKKYCAPNNAWGLVTNCPDVASGVNRAAGG